MKLYSGAEFASIPWPNTADGYYAKAMLGSFLRDGCSHYIANVKVDLYILIDGDLVLPISVPCGNTDNCYVCSPHEHYITYTLFELSVIGSKAIIFILRALIKSLSFWLKWGRIGQVVYINNWFLSTNLFPEIGPQQLADVTKFIKERFPGRAILIRSLTPYTNYYLMDNLRALGYDMTLSRQLYITDPKRPDYRKKRDFKSDERLFRKTNYEVINADAIEPGDYNRIIELYNALYVRKYTQLNPLFTREFIALAIRENVLTIKALRKNGRIDAVLGYFCRNGVMTTPLFGYDTSIDTKVGLYRLISNLLVKESEKQECILNQSSGASKFKMTRGCQPYLEYTAVYTKHVSLRQRMVWQSLCYLLRLIAEPLMLKFKL